jgi:hypothetical protein
MVTVNQITASLYLLALWEIRRQRQEVLLGLVSVQHQPCHFQAPTDVNLLEKPVHYLDLE